MIKRKSNGKREQKRVVRLSEEIIYHIDRVLQHTKFCLSKVHSYFPEDSKEHQEFNNEILDLSQKLEESKKKIYNHPALSLFTQGIDKRIYSLEYNLEFMEKVEERIMDLPVGIQTTKAPLTTKNLNDLNRDTFVGGSKIHREMSSIFGINLHEKTIEDAPELKKTIQDELDKTKSFQENIENDESGEYLTNLRSQLNFIENETTTINKRLDDIISYISNLQEEAHSERALSNRTKVDEHFNIREIEL